MTDVDNFLAHYGIRGMRWGIRHQPEPNSNRSGASDSDRKAQVKKVVKRVAIGAGVVAAAGLVAYGAYEAKNAIGLHREMGDLARFTKGLDPTHSIHKDELITKGSEFVRRSSKAETDFMTRTYVALGKEQGHQWIYGDHRISMEATRDFRAPSMTKQIDILNKTFGDQTRKDMLAKAAKGSIVSKRIINRATDKQIASKTVSELVNTHWRSPKALEYIAALKKEGYSAVADTNRLNDKVSRIIFDPSVFKVTNVEKLANNYLNFD